MSTVASGKASVDKMRAQRDDIKVFCDKIFAKNAQLKFSLFEAFDKIDALEREVLALKIVDISSRRSQ